MKKKLVALCLAGVMSVSALGGIPLQADAAETTVDEAVCEEGVIESLVADNGDVLTAIVPFTEEEIKAQEEAEGRIPQQFLDNLNDYVPGNGEISDGIEADAAEIIPGIDNITPSKGDVNSLVIFSNFEDVKYTDEFKTEFKKRVFASDTSDPNRKIINEAELSTTESPNYPYDSLRGYYQRASFGELNFYGEFHEFTASHKRDWYEQGDGVSQDNTLLYQDAINSWVEKILAEEAHKDDGKTDLEYLDEKLKTFDKDGDYQIDNCYFLCAGGNNGWSKRWWSYRTSSTIMIGSYRLSRLVQMVDSVSEPGVAEKDNVQDYIQTMIHETGHSLGLDDYYSYDSQNEGDDPKVKTNAMMFGNTSDQDGFAKMLLGWIPREKVWVITEKQVWNPETSKWEDYTGSYNLALDSYAKTGDLALIIPKKNDAEDWNWLYDQFIMVEHFKNELNDTIKPVKAEDPPVIQDGLRIFHVYGLLDSGGQKFIASNTDDTKIPLITDYFNEHRGDNTHDYLGAFTPGTELTATTDPASSFYSNPSGDGLTANSRVVDSGISIKNITASGNMMSFETSIVNPFADGPAIQEYGANLHYDENAGWYVKVDFTSPVNVLGGKNAVVYDYDKATDKYDINEKWCECSRVGRMISSNQYKRDTNTLYYMLDDVHLTDGMIVIPAGSLISDRGILNEELYGAITNVPEGAAPLTISPASNVSYGEAQTITITGPAGSKIYYTVDGSEPSSSSDKTKEYTEPFKITTSTVVKAIAESADEKPLTARVLASYTLEKVYFPSEKQDEMPTTKAITMEVGEIYRLETYIWAAEDADRSVTFTSDHPEIASVDEDGKIMAKKAGEAKISVSSNGTSESPAICTVTITAGAASKVKEKVVAEYDIKKAGEVMRQISKDLDGSQTLQEFGESEKFNGVWVAAIPDQTYTGKAVKPEVRVYDGVKVLEPANYTVSYKKNSASGEATATVKIKSSYKKVAPITRKFMINPANLQDNLIALDIGVKYTGKLQKPKPVLIWKSTGAKQALSTSNFTVKYYDALGEEVQGVQQEAAYIATITAKGKNFSGSIDAKIKVQKNNFLDKITVKAVTKTYTYTEGQAIIPQLDTDYTISVPKGFTTIEKKTFDDKQLVAEVYGNTAPGKMALVIRPGENSDFAGTKIVYLPIKKAGK